MSFAYGGIKIPVNTVAQVAYNAGFRGTALTEIVARCYVESSLYADIVNDSSQAQGLWQILPAAHPEFKGNLLPNKAWADPQTNANMAYSIYVAAGSSMSPWASDGSAWLVYVPQAQAAVAQINTSADQQPAQGSSSNGGSNTGANASASNPLTVSPVSQTGSTSLSGVVSFFTNTHNYLRLAFFVLGGLALLWGVSELMKGTPIGDAASATVKNVTETAGVAALA